MTELNRQIEKNDLPKIQELLKVVFNDEFYSNIERLGGMTNHSYKITRNDGSEYLLRIPGEGTERMINRSDERKSTKLACELSIDSDLLYFDNDGCKVMRFIKNAKPMNTEVMKQDIVIKQVADIFRKLHLCGKDTKVRFEVFEMANIYEKIIKENDVSLYEDYSAVKNKVIMIKNEMDEKFGHVRVPCHNDSLLGNWILDSSDRLWLIDWEYSGMNDPMWDLSCTSIECDYSEYEDDKLLTCYYGRKYTQDEKRRFMASKLYVDYLWTLWGLTRVPFDGEFMLNYSNNRYQRLRLNLSKIDCI